MIPILTDPWVTGISLHASNAETLAKVHALGQVCVVLRKLYPLEILPFIDTETHSQFQIMISNYKGSDRQTLRRFIHHFVMNDELNNGRPEVTMDCPDDLPESWLKVLAAKGNTDEPPDWRSPMIFVPKIRKEVWPAGNEINYKINDIPKKRNMIVIESYVDHPYFEPDIDPWRLKCVGEPKPDGTLHEKNSTCMRLPRPPQAPLSAPLGQIAALLATISNRCCETKNECFFLPRRAWDPTDKEEATWRNATLFLKERVPDGKKVGEYGYYDRFDGIWLWHEGEDHWDVQLPGGGYWSVSYDGRILKRRP